MRDNWSAMKRLIYLRGNPATGGAKYEIKTVTGAVPLSLPNAQGEPLISLVQYGKCAQATTPTPSAPVAIYCNNGRMVYSDYELPSGYKRVKGLKFNNDVYYLIEGFHLYGSDTVRLSVSITAACNIFGCYTTTTAQDNYSLYASVSSSAKYLRYNGGTYKSGWTNDDLGERFDIEITPYGSTGIPAGDDSWEEQDFETSADLCIGTTSTGASSAKLKGNLYGTFEVENRFWGIPCERQSDGVLGYYDTYSETFYEPIGGTPVSLGYDGDYMSEWWDGNGEVLSVYSNPSNKYNIQVPMLFGTPSHADEYDAVSGDITYNIGYYIIRDSDTFSASSAFGSTVYVPYFALSYGGNKDCTPLCSHFAGLPMRSSGEADNNTCFFDNDGSLHFRTDKTPEQFAAWVGEQAANGTPLVVFYRRATPQKSSIQARTIPLAEGSNTVAVTAEVSGIQVAATYKAVAQN